MANVSRYSKRISLQLSFEREDKGKDIALWTHEELLPFPKATKGQWYARKEGTGPKYLENAWNVHRHEMIARLLQAKKKAEQDFKNKHKDLVR